MEHLENVAEIITRSARLYGERIAYSKDGDTLSFRQLAHDAGHLAGHLRSLGVKNEVAVAVVLDKSLNFLRALAAILQAGAIYVPIDAKYPDDRVRHILKDSATRHVITTSAHVPRLSALVGPEEVDFIPIDEFEKIGQSHTIDKAKQPSASGNQVAYIIYTSGSTSLPKGVAIRHESLINYIQETVKMYGFNEQTRILSVKSFSFDASFTDIFCPLYAGGRVYLMDETTIFPQLVEDRIKHHRITHISCTIPVFKLLAQKGTFHPETYADMKTLSVGGDVMTPEAFHKIKTSLPHVRVFNRYGPTETTVACCTYEVTTATDQNKPVPIGKPHKNVFFRVLDEDGREIGKGGTGELYIGGVQVMEGYWRAPELTAKVVSNDQDGTRYYKTSDLVSLDENGDYVFLRRLDNIVKKHGYRISLDEIETAVVAGGLADECVCVFIPEDGKHGSRPRIVAYLKTQGDAEIDEKTREKLHRLLPGFMVPDLFIRAESIPKGPTGKVARQLLKQRFLDANQVAEQAL